MLVEMDSDVKAVLEFMQSNIPADRLVGVVESLPGAYSDEGDH
jgi:hypothetical protein